jgi:hypothetical protein
MSKKLIAVASASALALSALVGIAPANASAFTVAIASADFVGGTTTGLSSSDPATLNVPAENKLEIGTSKTAAGLDFTNLKAGDSISITTTGSVKVANEEADGTKDLDVTTLGKTSLTASISADVSPSDDRYVVYTTSTTAGSVTVAMTRAGLTSSTTFHIKGIAGKLYNINAVSGVPATLAKGVTSVVTFTVTDVFGNQIEDRITTANSIAGVSTDAVRTNMGLITWDAAAKVYKSTMTSPSSGAFIASIDLKNADLSVDGLADSKQELIATVNVSGVSTQVATLTTQLAEANAKLAKRVTKKRFNTLARKWNAAFPSQKVKLKK